MEKREFDQLGTFHQEPNVDLWQGRETAPELGPQYWYQAVTCIPSSKLGTWQAVPAYKDFGLLGYACDEGVRRNQGRVGAKTGPQSIRAKLGRIAWHHESKRILDLGDIVCPSDDMERAQDLISSEVVNLLEKGIFPMLLGGGHDLAYGHFKGLWKFAQIHDIGKLGVLNFDAHFDLRPVRKQANSGTPFWQIWQLYQQLGLDFPYLILGLQEQANTNELFGVAEACGAQYILHDQCREVYLDQIEKQVSKFMDGLDKIYISIDLDGFSSAFAPGVSATSPVGFSPHFVEHLLQKIMGSGKVIGLDIVELNPVFDQDACTAKLAARLIDVALKSA